MAASLKNKQRQPSVYHRGVKKSIKNIGEHNMLSIFKIFTEVATLAASGGLVFMASLYVVHFKMFFMTFTNILCFLLELQHHEKVVEKSNDQSLKS